MLLAASHGESSRSIAEALGVARDTARLWIRRYGEGGLKSVAKDRERAGRPRKLTPALEEEIVAKTVSEKPPPEKSTHWSSRLLADEMGLNHVDVWRTWSKFGLKPHKVRRFKLSRDPRLVEKLNGIAAVPHGFRSSFRDWAAEETNHPREVIEAALAHVVQNRVEAAYRRTDLFDRRRRLMDDWAAYLAGAPREPEATTPRGNAAELR